LEALSLYKNNLENNSRAKLRLLILGDGELRKTLENQVRTLGLEQDVMFMGTRRDLEAVYSGLDIIASTSLNEGTPLAVIEGMSSSRPIIATAVGGIGDLLGKVSVAQSDGCCDVCERGVLVRIPEAGSFSRGLARLASDKVLQEQMATRGRAFVCLNHSPDRFKDVMDLYANIDSLEPTVYWKDTGVALGT
jgi:glycosyltransferase involved in cell wall biosynthesis